MNIAKKIIHKFRTRCSNCISIKEIGSIKPNVIIDVRSMQEYREGHIDGAICIPLYEIPYRIEHEVPNKNALIIIYCKSGIRSKKAVQILLKKGYTNVYHINNGLDG